MAGKAAELGGVRVSDYLSVGLLSRLVPPSLVDEALTAHDRHSKRQRDIPAHAVAYYVMALSLYRGVNTEEVLRVVTEGMDYLGAGVIRREVGKSGTRICTAGGYRACPGEGRGDVRAPHLVEPGHQHAALADGSNNVAHPAG